MLVLIFVFVVLSLLFTPIAAFAILIVVALFKIAAK
jgi:hypothetical protein